MFSKHTLKYFLGITLLTFAYLLIGIPFFLYFKSQICLINFISVLVFFLLSNLFFHSFLIIFIEKNPKKFLQIFLLLTISKILIYMIFLVVFLLNLKFGIKCYLVSFLLIYLGFTLYEVIMLSKFLKNIKTK